MGETWRPPPDYYRSGPPPPGDRDFEYRNARRDDHRDDHRDDRRDDRRDHHRDDRRDDRRSDRRADHHDNERNREPYYRFRGGGQQEHDEDRRGRYPSKSYRSNAPHSPLRSGDSYRPSGDNFDFSFRYDAPQSMDMNREFGPRQPLPPRPTNGRSGGYQDASRRARGGRDRYSNRGGYSRKAADRPFLKTQRAPTPELMPGMDEEEGDGTKYRAIEDMSDSDETDMDLSTDDDNTQSLGDDTADQPKKKQPRTEFEQAADGDSVPRWSNPDPYTALPPPDETHKKKKDVVKLIRKARVTKSTEEAPKPQAAADDFISFDFDDDGTATGKEASAADELNDTAVDGFPEAPSGPRYSHRDNLHAQLPSFAQPPPTQQPPTQQPQTQLPPVELPPTQPPTASLGNYAILDVSSDPALGSRKRTHDDTIKGPPRYTKKNISGPANGNIVKEWQINDETDPVPWCVNDHSRTVNMGDWLHKEIVDFYNHVKPRDFEQTMRDELVETLRHAVKRHFRDADILPFGSFVAGLYLPTADMDLVMVSNQFMQGRMGKYATKSSLFKFREFLTTNRIAAPSSIELIIGAKVPIVKYVDRVTGLRVDISFENDSGITANETFRKWKEEFPAMPILVTLIKQFLTMRGLNEPVNGGIGGFSVICLVVSLLQHMPQVQSGNMVPEYHLGEILMEFFDLYGNEFNTMTTAIQMNPPAYLPKSVAKQIVYKLNQDGPRFTIIDPNNSGNDIAGGSRNTRTIVRAFSEAFAALQQRMSELQRLPMEQRRGQSILGVILAGNYSSFDEQRRYLSHLHSSH